MKKIGLSVKKNYLRMRFALQPLDGIKTFMQDILEEKYKFYCSVPNKYWCNLLSATEAKYNRNQSVDHTKRLASSKAEPANYDRDTYTKVTHKNKARTSVLLSHKQQGKKTLKYKGSYNYCLMCTKDGTSKRKYKFSLLKKNLLKKVRPGICQGRPGRETT